LAEQRELFDRCGLQNGGPQDCRAAKKASGTLFSFFISIIPSLMPVVGLKELHLKASHLGYLFMSMAVGSVISGAFIIPWARARYSPQRITTVANLVLFSLPISWCTNTKRQN
jgi:hypothetical protein